MIWAGQDKTMVGHCSRQYREHVWIHTYIYNIYIYIYIQYINKYVCVCMYIYIYHKVYSSCIDISAPQLPTFAGFVGFAGRMLTLPVGSSPVYPINTTVTSPAKQNVTPRLSGWWARATPLKNMSSSIGMIIPNPIYFWENKKWQPNHQPAICLVMTYRRWTKYMKYSNPFHLVQPPCPQSSMWM